MPSFRIPWYSPVEVAAIDNGSAHLCGMTIHVFRCAVCYDVCSPLEGPTVDGCSEGIVHDEWHAIPVRYLGKAFYVEHVAPRVGYGFSEETLCVVAEGGFYFFVGGIWVNESAFYAEFPECGAEEVECAAINACDGYKVAASLADIEDGIEVCCLTA